MRIAVQSVHNVQSTILQLYVSAFLAKIYDKIYGGRTTETKYSLADT